MKTSCSQMGRSKLAASSIRRCCDGYYETRNRKQTIARHVRCRKSLGFLCCIVHFACVFWPLRTLRRRRHAGMLSANTRTSDGRDGGFCSWESEASFHHAVAMRMARLVEVGFLSAFDRGRQNRTIMDCEKSFLPLTLPPRTAYGECCTTTLGRTRTSKRW